MAASPTSSSGSRRRLHSPGPSAYDRSTSSSYPSASSSRPHPRSLSPTASTHSSSAYSRRNYDEPGPSAGPPPGALPSRPTFDPKGSRRYDRRAGDRPDRDQAGNTKPFYDRERDRDPGPSTGGRDSWVAPGGGGGGKARGGGGLDDGWNSRRRGGDRPRDRDRDRDARDVRGGGDRGGRAVYEREAARAGDYNDRPPSRQPPPHLSESSSANLNAPSSNANSGWQRRPNPPPHDSDRSSGYSSRPRNAAGNTQPYSRAGAGPSNYSRPPPPSSMVDPSLWRTSYNPPPPSDQYPSLEYDPPARPGTNDIVSTETAPPSSEVVRSGSGKDSPIQPASIYDGQKRDEEPEEGEELEEGEVQSEDGEKASKGRDSSRSVKIEQIVEAALLASREDEAPSPRRSRSPPIPIEPKGEPPPSQPPSSNSLPSLPLREPSLPLADPASPESTTPPFPSEPLPSIPSPRTSSTLLPPPTPAVIEPPARLSLEPSPPPSPAPLPRRISPPVELPTSSTPLSPVQASPSSAAAPTVEPLLPGPSFTPASAETLVAASISAELSPGPPLAVSLPPPSPAAPSQATSPPRATAEASNSSLNDQDAPMSSPVTPLVSDSAPIETTAESIGMAVDAKREVETEAAPVEVDDLSTADVSMDVEPELKESEEERVSQPAGPLTEEEIAEVVVSQVQSRVSLNPSTAVLEDDAITSLIHFNTLLCDPPSSRLPLTPISLANGSPVISSSPPPDLEPELPLSLSPLPSRSRQLVQVRIQVSIQQDSEKIERLRSEYRSINAEWQATCQRLDRITEKRNAAQANGSSYNQSAAPNGNLFTPTGAPTPGGGGGVFGYGGANGGGSTHNTPGGPPSLVSTFLEESSRSSRASRSRANNQDSSLGYFADAARTEAEFQSILTALEDADSRDPNLRAARTTAVVPDMILRDMERLEDSYDDENGLVRDPEDFYREQEVGDGSWTQEEKEIFEKRFAGYPKQFGKIAEQLPHKTAPQCVLYYYRTKKTIDYRTIVAQRGGAGRRKGGRRAGNKGSRLLSNLNQGKRVKPTIDEPIPNRSGTATPRVDDDDTSTPPTPAAGGETAPAAKKKRSRVAGGDQAAVDESGHSSAFGAQAKKPRLFDLSADGASQGRATSGRGDEVLTGRSLNPPDPSAARLAAIEAGEMTPAPKKPSTAKPRRKKPTSVVAPPPSSVLDPSTPSPDSLDPPRPHDETLGAHIPNGVVKESNNKRKKSLVNSYWSAAEKAGFMQGLMSYGKEWQLISQSMAGVKTAIQVKNYFSANAEQLGLEEIAEAAMGDLVALLNGADEDVTSADPASHFEQPQAALFESLDYSTQSRPDNLQPHRQALPPMDLGRPRTSMSLHDLLNSPDKPLPSASSSASRPPPPMWQQPGNEYDRDRRLEAGKSPSNDDLSRQRDGGASREGAVDGRIPAPHPSSAGGDSYQGGLPQRWGAPSPLGYSSEEPRRPSSAYEQDSRSAYPPPPHHYPPTSSDRSPYHTYTLPASHPPPMSSSLRPYGEYYPPSSNINNSSLPLPSRPYSAGPPPGSSSNWPPPPPSHYHRPTSDYGPHPQQHSPYHSYARYSDDRGAPEGHYGGGTPPPPPPQEYQRGSYPDGAYDRERLGHLAPGGSGPEGGSWGGPGGGGEGVGPSEWQQQQQGTRRVS